MRLFAARLLTVARADSSSPWGITQHPYHPLAAPLDGPVEARDS